MRATTFSNYIPGLERSPRRRNGKKERRTRAVPARAFSPPRHYSFPVSRRSHCLSLRFTFPRHDGDGDVRFNKAPGMSRHVMHSIACEIYVNTAIRPVTNPFPLSLRCTHPPCCLKSSRSAARIKSLYVFLILIPAAVSPR